MREVRVPACARRAGESGCTCRRLPSAGSGVFSERQHACPSIDESAEQNIGVQDHEWVCQMTHKYPNDQRPLLA
jgi:hypothetical protein